MDVRSAWRFFHDFQRKDAKRRLFKSYSTSQVNNGFKFRKYNHL